jgi:hypothetical protein
MRGWLKLVGTSQWQLPEAWGIERKDLLREVRFSELHPPESISRRDRLVYHAVGHQRIVALVEVLDDEASLDPHPSEWEKQWPLILHVRPLVRIARVSWAPPTSSLGQLPDLVHQGFVPLTDAQLQTAERLLANAGHHD